MFAISCKKGAAKLDINDVNAHRAYQDSLLKKSSISIEILQVIRQLVNEYRDLEVENKDSNTNYNYYVSRLYSHINYIPPMPIPVKLTSDSLPPPSCMLAAFIICALVELTVASSSATNLLGIAVELVVPAVGSKAGCTIFGPTNPPVGDVI